EEEGERTFPYGIPPSGGSGGLGFRFPIFRFRFQYRANTIATRTTITIARPRTRLPLSEVTAWLIPGTGEWYVTDRVTAVAWLPAGSVATAVIVWLPSGRTMSTEKSPPDATDAEIPSTVTAASASVVPVTCTTFVSTLDPAAGTVRMRMGGVVSRLTERVTLAVFPAASRATTVIVFGPSPRWIVRLKAPVVAFPPVV